MEMPCLSRYLSLHEIAIYDFVQQSPQLGFKFCQVNRGSGASREIRHLTVDATPVTCIVRIKIDSDRHTAGTTRNNGINIGHPGYIAAMICYIQSFGNLLQCYNPDNVNYTQAGIRRRPSYTFPQEPVPASARPSLRHRNYPVRRNYH